MGLFVLIREDFRKVAFIDVRRRFSLWAGREDSYARRSESYMSIYASQ